MTKIRKFFILSFILISEGHCLAIIHNAGRSYGGKSQNNNVPNSIIVTSIKDGDHGRNRNSYGSNNNDSGAYHHVINLDHPTKSIQAQLYDYNSNTYKNQQQSPRFITSSHLIHKINNIIKTTFLPSGYPQTTPNGYLSYSIWSWIQDLSTQLRAVLATLRVLEGVGVGKEGATALSASLNFIVRDGCGMASTLLFTALASSRFRSNVKKWRILADVMNDVGITLEVAATLVPSYFFLPMICAGNMCKAICGVAAGACNSAINLHWAKGSDISDINAKFGAQHTVTGGLGLLFAAMFARSVSSAPTLVLWSLYSLLTFIHILANIRCIRLISFDYLNRERMDLVVKNFLIKMNNLRDDVNNVAKMTMKSSESINGSIVVDDPTTISKVEPLFFKPIIFSKWQSIPIQIGASFNDIVRILLNTKDSDAIIQLFVDQMEHEKYFVFCGGKEIFVVINENADSIVKVKAYFHACVMRKKLLESKFSNDIALLSFEVYRSSALDMKKLWPIFFTNASSVGWDLKKTTISTRGFYLSIQNVAS